VKKSPWRSGRFVEAAPLDFAESSLKHFARYDQLRRPIDELIAVRKRTKFSQVALRARLGKDQTWVSRYELTRRHLAVMQFLEIAKAIGVDPCGLPRKLGGQSSIQHHR
jgi:hypothetical protein